MCHALLFKNLRRGGCDSQELVDRKSDFRMSFSIILVDISLQFSAKKIILKSIEGGYVS